MKREVWHFQKANVDHIKNAINGFQWVNMNVNNTVHLFHKTIKNILNNFIPREKITYDDRDPLWIGLIVQ